MKSCSMAQDMSFPYRNALLSAWLNLSVMLMVSVLIVVLKWTGHDGLAALSGLGVLIPYYIMLWLFRDRMREQLAFSLEVN